MCCHNCPGECRLKNLSLEIENAEDFVSSEWGSVVAHWIIRVLAFMYTTGFLLYSVISNPYDEFVIKNASHVIISNKTNFTDEYYENDLLTTTTPDPGLHKKYFTYVFLTVWSYTILALYFLVAFCNLFLAQCLRSRGDIIDLERKPLLSGSPQESFLYTGIFKWSLKLQWFLWTIASNAAFIVTFAYWSFLYPQVRYAYEKAVSFHDVSIHGLNSVFILIEVMTSAHPIKYLHMMYTYIYALLYIIWSLIFWAVDHTNVIYPIILDWNNAGIVIGVIFLLALVCLPVAQGLLFGAYKLRRYLGNKWSSDRRQQLQTIGYLT